MNKINRLTILLFAVGAFAFTSCLKDDDEVFSESSTARMTNYLNNAREVLLSSEYGWVMDMYPEEGQSYGGYAYTLRFTEDSVFVRSELAQDNSTNEEAASLWALTNDDGPVFTVDTYNELFHFFSTPWQDTGGNGYQAYQGEFEYVIMNVTDDVITFRGKKTGNTVYLRRLAVPAEQYLQELGNLTAQFIVNGLNMSLGDNKGVAATIDNESRQIMFVRTDTITTETETTVNYADTVMSAFAYTPEGLRLYKEVEVAGMKFYQLDYEETQLQVNGKAMDGTESGTLKCLLPENYLRYEDIPEGEYRFSYGKIRRYTCTVSLERSEDGRSFWMSGLNDRFKVRLDYVRATGSLSLVAQELNTIFDDGYVLWFCPLSDTAGDGSRYFSWTTSIGMVATWSGANEAKPTFNFADNGNWTSFETVAFFLAVFKGSTPTSDGYDRYQTNYMDPVWCLAGQSPTQKDDPTDESETPAKITVANSTIEYPRSLEKL